MWSACGTAGVRAVGAVDVAVGVLGAGVVGGAVGGGGRGDVQDVLVDVVVVDVVQVPVMRVVGVVGMGHGRVAAAGLVDVRVLGVGAVAGHGVAPRESVGTGWRCSSVAWASALAMRSETWSSASR